MKKTVYKYYLLNRFPAIGTHPAGEQIDERYTFSPAAPIPEHPERVALGLVGYLRKLSFDDLFRYDLLPADPLHAAYYAFWRFAERNQAEYERLLAEYRYTGRDYLQGRQRKDHLAEAMLAILEYELPVFHQERLQKVEPGRTLVTNVERLGGMALVVDKDEDGTLQCVNLNYLVYQMAGKPLHESFDPESESEYWSIMDVYVRGRLWPEDEEHTSEYDKSVAERLGATVGVAND